MWKLIQNIFDIVKETFLAWHFFYIDSFECIWSKHHVWFSFLVHRSYTVYMNRREKYANRHVAKYMMIQEIHIVIRLVSSQENEFDRTFDRTWRNEENERIHLWRFMFNQDSILSGKFWFSFRPKITRTRLQSEQYWLFAYAGFYVIKYSLKNVSWGNSYSSLFSNRLLMERILYIVNEFFRYQRRFKWS